MFAPKKIMLRSSSATSKSHPAEAAGRDEDRNRSESCGLRWRSTRKDPFHRYFAEDRKGLTILLSPTGPWPTRAHIYPHSFGRSRVTRDQRSYPNRVDIVLSKQTEGAKQSGQSRSFALHCDPSSLTALSLKKGRGSRWLSNPGYLSCRAPIRCLRWSRPNLRKRTTSNTCYLVFPRF
ncbi:MAG: hypothetical protein OJF58_005056 [Enhydrobacter sp.]|nr:MAG: hypothetical protein OJF58_005056 [Enhydrobacter sp.]